MSSMPFPDPPARLHFIGIKGVGMTALAEIFLRQGYSVSGSDSAETFPTDSVLKRLNILVAETFDVAHLTINTAAVIYSTAYDDSNVERQAADELAIPQWSYPEALGLLIDGYSRSVAVAGSHGKTTTTAMLASIMETAGLDPTAVVGAPVRSWGSNARTGLGEWFVFEADEYQNKLQYYHPRVVIVTNIDFDHPDFFKDAEAYREVFSAFVKRVPEDGVVVLPGDDKKSMLLKEVVKATVVTFGLSNGCDWQAKSVLIDNGQTTFQVYKKGEFYGNYRLHLPGEHYALDALSAIVVADEAGVSVDISARSLEQFHGTARRFELRGTSNDNIIIDDYAHHPAEISAVIKALRSGYKDIKLIIVFQGHTYSRTAELLDNFAEALSKADVVILPPIYASAREKEKIIDHHALGQAVEKRQQAKVVCVDSFEDAVVAVGSEAGPAVVVTMGAGDVWQVAEKLLS